MLRTVSHLGLFLSKLHTDLDSPVVFQANHTLHEEERDRRGRPEEGLTRGELWARFSWRMCLV